MAEHKVDLTRINLYLQKQACYQHLVAFGDRIRKEYDAPAGNSTWVPPEESFEDRIQTAMKRQEFLYREEEVDLEYWVYEVKEIKRELDNANSFEGPTGWK